MLEIVKSLLDTILGNVLLGTLPEQGGWTRWPPEAPSHLSRSVIPHPDAQHEAVASGPTTCSVFQLPPETPHPAVATPHHLYFREAKNAASKTDIKASLKFLAALLVIDQLTLWRLCRRKQLQRLPDLGSILLTCELALRGSSQQTAGLHPHISSCVNTRQRFLKVIAVPDFGWLLEIHFNNSTSSHHYFQYHNTTIDDF